MQGKSSLRRKLRQSRRNLSVTAQRQAAQSLACVLLRQPIIQRAQKIALYWPSDGEISALPLLKRLQQQGKKVYLPVIKPAQGMEFKALSLRYLKSNQFGIVEPLAGESIAVKRLDIILMPLVGFDEQGGRLGMGGGYYDRALAFKLRQTWNNKPYLIGLAHEQQKIAHLPIDPWDVPMAAVATDKRFIRVS